MINKTSPGANNYVPEKPSLKIGLLALKQKNYYQAIAHLKIIAEQESLKEKLRAKIGLVIAYEKTKQVDNAISLCRNLTKVSDSKIQSFADLHLKELLKQYPPQNLTRSTIPTPKSPELSPQNQQPLETEIIPFHPTSDNLKSAQNQNKISKQNIDLSVGTGFHSISKKSNNFPKKSTPKSPELSPQNQQPLETEIIPFHPTSDNLKSAQNQNEISKQNIDLPVETGFHSISKKTNDLPENYSQTSDFVQHSQSNKNHIEINKNQSPDLSKIVNKSNLKKTNKSDKISKKIAYNSQKNVSQTSDFVQHSQSNKNHIEINKNQSPDLSKIVNKSNSESTEEFHKTSTNTTSNQTENSPKLKWHQAGRAKAGRRLKSPNLTLLWIEQIVVIITLFWLSLTILKFSLDATNDFLVWLPYSQPIQIFYRDPTRNFIIFLTVLFIFSPWLIDGLLILTYNLQTLPTTTLINYSKEANKLLRNFCKKQKIKKITLKVLPIDVPIAFSYGCLPRFFRIVVSQGLLDNLAEDEIATIYAREISHVKIGDFRLISLANLMLQVPYTIYWQLTFWADWILNYINHKLPDSSPKVIKSFLPILVSGFRILTAIISTLSYGLYWLLKFPIYSLSRQRIYYSDRLACNLTYNPNGLTRALLKITIGMANDIENQGKTRHLLESFEILMPVGINQAIATGSLILHSDFESIFNWDIISPYRRWLEINNTHPLLGDRLKKLSLYANLWKLETELDLENINADVAAKNKLISVTENKKISISKNIYLPKLLLQGAPFFGILIGLGFAICLWLIGIFSSVIGLWRLDWLFGDVSILVGCLTMGFSIGILMRINQFFPDLKLTKILQNSDLLELLTNPNALPLDSQIIQLKGQLLGKSGMSNWLGQDLILQTTKGLIKLHYSNRFGPIGNLWPKMNRPSDFVGKSVTVTGWWRRGATPWIDVNTIKAENCQSINSDHPLWSTILAVSLAIWGAYVVSTGKF
ncbi:M48 family metalloprotease [Okeania sp.]|uniref:M48 family metalloprotease n=1 Tax=Okeania sp. TaxID=3100323 RepID=UPI002B4AE941|nr:M48 family metalloprotease [Okeania sp.]MEB3340489.1 M48 family metalloprotease [Okeania sp.]